MKIISANVGFVTNSSSVVYHFPREILEDESIKAFIKAFEIEEGYVGDNLWSRDTCQSFAITKDQKEAIANDLNDFEYGNIPNINTKDESIVLVYGDEYHEITSILIRMMIDVANTLGVKFLEEDYN